MTSYDERPISVRKSTRRWCKAKVGREHIKVLKIDPRRAYGGFFTSCEPWRFRMPSDTGPAWRCLHHEVCVDCGKITNYYPLCPDIPDGYVQH